ncbi:MAG TPA: prolipoprotein diacylglyceryl transferase [Gemmatimonadales bacterium]|nr:prolipoprotein diacylglyceryl transferase [Gemmatimonadales bacterium]
MTVYPFAIHFGSFAITGFGLMMMAAFLTAGWVLARAREADGEDPALAWDCVVAAVIGGLLGAKLYYAVLTGRADALFSRGGLVWYGGLLGGSLAVLGLLWWRRVGVRAMADQVAPALMAGYALGRVGCFLVGDDYGLPTSLPWGMKFPQGSPPTTVRSLQSAFGIAPPEGASPDTIVAVHPTQLYEVTAALVLFALLWRWRKRFGPQGRLAAVALVALGTERLLVELLRAKDDRFLGPFTLAQAISAMAIVAGVVMFRRLKGATGAT